MNDFKTIKSNKHKMNYCDNCDKDTPQKKIESASGRKIKTEWVCLTCKCLNRGI